MPQLLDIQTRSFQALLATGEAAAAQDLSLERVFHEVFPITDVNGNYSLEFVAFALGEPKYTVEECIERDMTYSAPLKATLRLIIMEEVTPGTRRPKNILEKEVYLGELPLLTPLGTFVINGAERVIVSQLHRSRATDLPIGRSLPKRPKLWYEEPSIDGRKQARPGSWTTHRATSALRGTRRRGRARLSAGVWSPVAVT